MDTTIPRCNSARQAPVAKQSTPFHNGFNPQFFKVAVLNVSETGFRGEYGITARTTLLNMLGKSAEVGAYHGFPFNVGGAQLGVHRDSSGRKGIHFPYLRFAFSQNDEIRLLGCLFSAANGQTYQNVGNAVFIHGGPVTLNPQHELALNNMHFRKDGGSATWYAGHCCTLIRMQRDQAIELCLSGNGINKQHRIIALGNKGISIETKS